VFGYESSGDTYINKLIFVWRPQWCLDVDERKTSTWGLSSTQWYIFGVEKPKKQNVLMRAFRGTNFKKSSKLKKNVKETLFS
jgi:hypothetical protein